MATPQIVDRKPKPTEVEAGKEYLWCACGHSKTQPWTDGECCKNNGFTPRKFTATETGTSYMCMCKYTKNPEGKCDGTHRSLPPSQTPTTPREPHIAGRAPKPTEVEAGKEYLWCACGHSKTQPWTDGECCKKNRMVPRKFTATETGTSYMCMCKYTKNPEGKCDGTHRNLPEKSKVGDIEDLAKGSDPLDAGPTEEEPTLALVKSLARDGLSKVGHHGEMSAMGVPRPTLPSWDDIQFVTAQLATKPLLDDHPVSTKLIIGPKSKRPLELSLPIFVSDMSFGALSEEAKLALAKGAELAGTGICSGEGGMLPEEQQANSRYFYELASAKFGWHVEHAKKVQAFHFKGGQGAKTGTGGHLPGNKVVGKIAQVRELKEGQSAVSPATFVDLKTPEDFKKIADEVREVSGGIPIGFKISAQHIEKDIQFAYDCSVDYIILDGRGGGTGAAPIIFRDNISVPTIPALARARRYLDKIDTEKRVTLLVTGGLRTPADFAKALAMGADGIGISNSALQSIGCVAARMCNTNQCPVGVATQNLALRKLLDVDKGAKQLCNFLTASSHLMQVLARACGHNELTKFNRTDLTTWKRDMAELSGVPFSGVGISYAWQE